MTGAQQPVTSCKLEVETMPHQKIFSLWVGQSLSRLEQECLKSWRNHGYDVELFVYENVSGVPSGIKLSSGELILPKSEIFYYSGPKKRGGGSVSSFSNYFRYKLLQRGGTWVDTDVFCLRRLPDSNYLFVKERKFVASCLIRMPPNSEISKWCFEQCLITKKKSLKWGHLGPRLVARAVAKFSLQHYVQPERDFLPVMFDQIELFFKPGEVLGGYTVHFWNEMWRRKGFCKEKIYGSDTLYESILNRSL